MSDCPLTAKRGGAASELVGGGLAVLTVAAVQTETLKDSTGTGSLIHDHSMIKHTSFQALRSSPTLLAVVIRAIPYGSGLPLGGGGGVHVRVAYCFASPSMVGNATVVVADMSTCTLHHPQRVRGDLRPASPEA
jgi:hypothetical protein